MLRRGVDDQRHQEADISTLSVQQGGKESHRRGPIPPELQIKVSFLAEVEAPRDAILLLTDPPFVAFEIRGRPSVDAKAVLDSERQLHAVAACVIGHDILRAGG